MGLSVTGYVLEPPRVGQSNSPFTMTPNVYVSDPSAFNAAYPSDESVPRTEYHVFVLNDFASSGTGPGGVTSFADVTFCWTKNEVVQRFDYEGAEGRFKTLPGGAIIVVGTLTADANANRLRVPAPISSDTGLYPVRISIGTDSGTTFTATVVLNDGSFTVPTPGTVQISQATGNLNWNPADLATFLGQTVRFQRQTFYTFDDSTGNLGSIGEPLLLNPLPASGQFPLVRIGFGEYLTPVEVPDEMAFSLDPAAGTVQWAADTGRLKFNSGDVASNAGRDVYYDGVTFAYAVKIKTLSLGTVASPGNLSPLPPEESDLFFRVVGAVQFPETQFVDVLTSPGKRGVVQVRRSDGQVQFSAADVSLYGALSVQAVVADLDIERGMTLRLFRTPVNLDGEGNSLKNATAFYVSTGAVWADPIIASPNVVLPAVPVDTRPLVVEVQQGTGSFTGILPRLDVASPSAGLGYVLNFEERNLLFAQRKVDTVLPAPVPYGGVQLPDPLVFNSNLVLEVETAPGSGIYTPLTVGEDALIDLDSGFVTLVSTNGSLVTRGSTGSFSGSMTFTDLSQDFSNEGVQQGDFLIVLTGTPRGVYRVNTVGTTTLTTTVAGEASGNLSYEVRRGVEILADRFFLEVPPVDPNTRVEKITPLGTITNSPRLAVDPAFAGAMRFRFGKTSFSTSTVLVPDDSAFTPPGSLLEGTVQISLDTGNLNFSQADVSVGGTVYAARTLVLGADYTLQPPLGFVQLSERLLGFEEVLTTYKNANGVVVQERASFLIRKEFVEHPTPTSTMSYNPLGREPAELPSPRAFRGGRPQTSSQVIFDIPSSTLTFVGQPTITNALPSGPIVNPNESIYVDYSVHEAIGGEQNYTVLQPPMQGSTVLIEEGTTSFQMAGDRSSVFPPNTLLLVDRTEAYLVGASSYDSGTQITTITLAPGQTFRSDQRNPPLSVSSGPIRVNGTALVPSYFTTEISAYAPVPRGSTKFSLVGDHSRTYVAGTIVFFSDGTYFDFYVVSGSVSNEGRTEVTLISSTVRQYDGVGLKRSVRPVLPSSSASVTTSKSPELGQPFLVFRRVEGQTGRILEQPDDYSIDGSGAVNLSTPLGLNEEVGIFYTGDLVIEAGRSFRASYTFGVVPSDQNGLLNQILKADYTTYIPDTFFWRVETFTNFRGELVQLYGNEAKASVPTGGPTLENAAQPRLFEQGRESLFFREGFLANEDLVARPTLKYYNDLINFLEDVLEQLDGRIVGDHDGRFLFDGLIDNPPRNTFAEVTNQIDDLFKISPAPYAVTGPPFTVTSIGTYREVYKPAATSRFYPTHKVRFGVTVDSTGLSTGDPIMDTGVTNLTSVSNIHRRFPWAVTTAYAPAGSTVLQVDNAVGSTNLLRPSFVDGMQVAIVAQDGTVLVPDESSLTVSSFTATTVILTAVPVAIPVGSTIRLATNDTTYLKEYRLGIDLGVDLEKGLLTYQEPLAIWAALNPSPPGAGEILDVTVTYNNRLIAPERFPALDGGTTDDDGNRGFPILNPSADSENPVNGYLQVEQQIISVAGTLRASTTPTFVGVGNLDGTGTIITNADGAWPLPVPKVFDLVEIRTGPNAPSTFHRITAVGAATITVDPPFAVPGDLGFFFTITVSDSLETGSATVNPATVLTDASADFVTAGVQPGHTVVVTSGAFSGLRRQVVNVTSPTVLQIEALPGTTTATYRVDNSLETFGGTAASLIDAQLLPALAGQSNAVAQEILGVDSFFQAAFTSVASGSNGETNGSIFTATGQTFVDDGVNTSHLLFIRNGPAAGVYKIQSVDSQTSLTIDGSFPIALTGVPFSVVKGVGLSAGPLDGVLRVALDAEEYEPTIATFQALLTTSVAVEGDPSAFARRLTLFDLDAREAEVSARDAQIPNAVTAVENELSAGDRLYDARYVWIDARINLENGILVRKDLAREERIRAQEETLKNLIKLLSVESA